MKRITLFFIIRLVIAYAFFVLGCSVLDQQVLFEVLFPHFNKAPESSFLFLMMLLYISILYVFKLYRFKRMK